MNDYTTVPGFYYAKALRPLMQFISLEKSFENYSCFQGKQCQRWLKVTRGPWVTMLTWVNSYKSLIQHFRLSVAMTTNQKEQFVQLLYAWWRTTQQIFEPRHDKTCLREFPTRPDTNRPAQPQKLVRVLKFRLYDLEILYYLSSEQQRRWSDCADAQADLRLCCSHMT